MKFEDAFYYNNLLALGFSDEYNEWLNCRLESDVPLSDIVLELSLCASDIAKTTSLLHSYYAEREFDKNLAHDKLRLFFKEAYYSNKMSKKDIASLMYRVAVNACEGREPNCDLWESMYHLNYYYALAEDGYIPWESFDFAFFSYLDGGTPVDSDRIWDKNATKKQSLPDKIKSIFKK